MSSTRSRTVSVIVSTYEWPSALRVVLQALAEQNGPPSRIVVADDGSGAETADVVAEARRRLGDRIEHVRHEDRGFRKTRILNLAATRAAAHGEFLVFIDGDSIPRRGFLDAMRRAVIPGTFLAGKRADLSPAASRRTMAGSARVWRWSAARLLLAGAVPRSRPGLIVPGRDRRRAWRPGRGEFSPPYASYGFLFGVFRADFKRVNGYDMRYVGWGEEDVDIAVRLRRLGLRCGWAGPRSTLLHLSHPKRVRDARSNAPLLAETRASDRVEAIEGLRELEAEPGTGAA